MTILGIAAAVLLTAFVLSRVIIPFITDKAVVIDDKKRHLIIEKERLVRSLTDLEIDYRTGKISPEDFESMKLSTSRELADLLTVLDKGPDA